MSSLSRELSPCRHCSACNGVSQEGTASNLLSRPTFKPSLYPQLQQPNIKSRNLSSHPLTSLPQGVDRPRPCFYDQSQWGPPPTSSVNASAPPVMPVCNALQRLCWDARQSFPSGHASLAFAMCLHLCQVTRCQARAARRCVLFSSQLPACAVVTHRPQVLIAALRQLQTTRHMSCCTLARPGSSSAL